MELPFFGGNYTAACVCRPKNLPDLNVFFCMIKSPVNHLDDGNAERPDVHLKNVGKNTYDDVHCKKNLLIGKIYSELF
jgi:hypothetical protein